jgi:hypothetical protein
MDKEIPITHTSDFVGFEPVKMSTNKYVVTSGQFKGWHINMTTVLRKAVFVGVSDDGSPKFDLTYDIISTPTPPEKK